MLKEYDYKDYTAQQLYEGSFSKEPVRVRGIARGAVVDDRTIHAHLQTGRTIIPLFGKSKSKQNLSLLRTSSEADREVAINGLYSSDNANSGNLEMHRVDLGNNIADFNPQ